MKRAFIVQISSLGLNPSASRRPSQASPGCIERVNRSPEAANFGDSSFSILYRLSIGHCHLAASPLVGAHVTAFEACAAEIFGRPAECVRFRTFPPRRRGRESLRHGNVRNDGVARPPQDATKPKAPHATDGHSAGRASGA
jgi:hypothetical protein